MVRKGLDLQHPVSSCRSSTMDHDKEMALESQRKRQEIDARSDERRREEKHGDWSQRGKR